MYTTGLSDTTGTSATGRGLVVAVLAVVVVKVAAGVTAVEVVSGNVRNGEEKAGTVLVHGLGEGGKGNNGLEAES